MLSTVLRATERRRRRRYRVPMAIALEAGERKDRVAVALDVSVSGACFNTASRFVEGDAVTLTFMQRSLQRPDLVLTRCVARVVRIEQAPMGSPLLWRYVTAVKFERDLPEIEPVLQNAVSRENDEPGGSS